MKTPRNTDHGHDPIVKEVRDNAHAAWKWDRDNRIDQESDLQHLAGNQWPEVVRQQREKQGRPVLTINRLGQFVNQVVNDIRKADIAIKVSPSDGAVIEAEQVSDPQIEMEGGKPKPLTMAEVWNGLIREIQYQSRARMVYAQSVMHSTGCGIGHFRINTQWCDEMQDRQEIVLEGIPQPHAVLWDPKAVKLDRSDADWVIVTQMVARDVFQRDYPKAAEVSVERADVAETELYWSSDDEVRIAEYWKKVKVTKTFGRLKDGSVIELKEGQQYDPRQFETKQDGTPNIKEVETFKIVMYLVSGADQLEPPTDWAGKWLPIIPVIGTEIPMREKTYRHGLIRFARDPQMLYNYARSSAAEAMGQAPKSPWLVTAAMIKGVRDMWDTANKQLRPYLIYNQDPSNPAAKPERMPGPEVPAAYVHDAQVSDADIKSTIGVYDPQLGNKSTETSGRAILAKEEQGDTGTFHYGDNLRYSLEHAGRVIVDLIPRIYDTHRIQRIIGADDRELYVPLNVVRYVLDEQSGMQLPMVMNDLTKGKYDCRVRIGKGAQTRREETKNTAIEVMRVMPDSAPLIGDILVGNLDMEGSDAMAERLKRAVPEQVLGEDAPKKEPTPAEQQQMQVQNEMVMAQLGKLQAEVDLLRANAAKAEAEIELTRAKAEKTETEDELLPITADLDAEKWAKDRDDRLEAQEADRREREQERKATVTASKKNGDARA